MEGVNRDQLQGLIYIDAEDQRLDDEVVIEIDGWWPEGDEPKTTTYKIVGVDDSVPGICRLAVEEIDDPNMGIRSAGSGGVVPHLPPSDPEVVGT